MDNCKEIKKYLYDMSENEIRDDILLKSISDHLKNCSGCMNEYEKILNVTKDIKGAFLREELPANFTYKIKEKIEKSREDHFSFLLFWKRYRLAFAAVCVMIIFFMSLMIRTDEIKNGKNDQPLVKIKNDIVVFTEKEISEFEKIFNTEDETTMHE